MSQPYRYQPQHSGLTRLSGDLASQLMALGLYGAVSLQGTSYSILNPATFRSAIGAAASSHVHPLSEISGLGDAVNYALELDIGAVGGLVVKGGDIGDATGTSLKLTGLLDLRPAATANIIQFATNGFLRSDTSQLTLYNAGTAANAISFNRGGTSLCLASTYALGFAATTQADGGTVDTLYSRQSAGVHQFGTTANNALGTVACANVTASGTVTASQGTGNPTLNIDNPGNSGANACARIGTSSAGLWVAGANYGVRATAGNATTVPFTARGFASQTANLFECQNSAGTVLASVTASGDVRSSGHVAALTSLYADQLIQFGNPITGTFQTYLDGRTNGNLLLSNATSNGFNRLQLGGTTSAYPAIKRSTNAIDFRLADDSDYCPITSRSLVVTNTILTPEIQLYDPETDEYGVLKYNDGAYLEAQHPIYGFKPLAYLADLETKQPVSAFLTTLAAIGETSGTGNLARVTSPTFVTPALGAASATSLNIAGTGSLTQGTTSSIYNETSQNQVYFNYSNGNGVAIRGTTSPRIYMYGVGGPAGASGTGLIAWANTTLDGSPSSTISQQASGIVQIGTTAANALGSLACYGVTLSGGLTANNISQQQSTQDWNFYFASGNNSGSKILWYGPTNNRTSGSQTFMQITPIYNQTSGTASNTDLLINRTQTAVGSGTQLLINAQVNSVSMFRVSNAGNIRSVSQNWVSYGGAGADTTFDGNNLVVNYATFVLKNNWGSIDVEGQTAVNIKSGGVQHLFCNSGTSAFTGNVTASGTLGFSQSRLQQSSAQTLQTQCFDTSLAAWQETMRSQASPVGAKWSVFGATPIVQQTLPAAATDAATTQTLCNAIRSLLISFGFSN